MQVIERLCLISVLSDLWFWEQGIPIAFLRPALAGSCCFPGKAVAHAVTVSLMALAPSKQEETKNVLSLC